MIEAAVRRVEAGEHLAQEEMATTIGLIMDGRCPDEEIARLLKALHEKGETVDEVAGAAEALRAKMAPIRLTHSGAIDIVGTGGDRSGTFNISTAAALVTAAAGVPVAKHGNRAVTSRSGASDVLTTLGVNIEADLPTVEACLEELGICFCFAPLYHATMKHVAPVRKKLNMPTIFNILGPLANPASARFQLLGVGRPELRPLLAETVARLGTQRTLVVHGTDGLDEVSLAASTDVTEVTPEGLRQYSWQAADFGLTAAAKEELLVDGPEESAQRIREILAGKPGPCRDIVVLNAAAALFTVGRETSLKRCAELATAAIDSGATAELLRKLADRTRGR